MSGFRSVSAWVLYGPTGVGKSRAAFALGGDDAFSVTVPGKDIWFDGYEGERTLIIDEFAGQIRLQYLLRLLDGYPLQLPVKGGHAWALYTEVIITSNYSPISWYRDVFEGDVNHPQYKALMRRFGDGKRVIEMKKPYFIDDRDEFINLVLHYGSNTGA